MAYFNFSLNMCYPGLRHAHDATTLCFHRSLMPSILAGYTWTGSLGVPPRAHDGVG